VANYFRDEMDVAPFLAWIIHYFAGEKRKDALKEVMNTGFWRTQHSLSEHPRDDILLYTTAFLFLTIDTAPYDSIFLAVRSPVTLACCPCGPLMSATA
jgi:hypothetical protein